MRAPSQEPVQQETKTQAKSKPPPKQQPAPRIPTKIGALDMEEFSRNLARLVEEGGRALAAYLKPREEARDDGELADEVTEVVKTLGQVAEYWLADPQRTIELQANLGKAYLDLWASAVKRLAGEPAAPVVTPAAGDKRFNDPEWTQNQFFDFLKQAYLLTAQWADKLVDATDLSPHTKQKAEFYVRQITNALAPTNFVLTNPELLRETLTS
ncbi:MAG TPA: class I poly(R)-hydroxyalkanoic acid synthase, partial [Xanthobacteraceae bacterium]|nr:class I poly(R)-hydroxyalkanoic acid synthase [Xanthobacteraceae bacterium]